MISNPLRDLARHPVRSGLALAGIAVTTAMLLDMVLLAGGIERSFERMLLGRGYQIRVSPKGTLPFDTEATIPGAAEVIRTIGTDRAIAAVGPLLGTSVYARQGDSLTTLFGYGVDPTAQALYQLEAGDDLTAGDSTGLLISATVANLLGLKIGDSAAPGRTARPSDGLGSGGAQAGRPRQGSLGLRLSGPAFGRRQPAGDAGPLAAPGRGSGLGDCGANQE